MENPLQPCQTAQLAGLFATRGLCPAMCLKERFLTLMTDLNQGEGQYQDSSKVVLYIPPDGIKASDPVPDKCTAPSDRQL